MECWQPAVATAAYALPCKGTDLLILIALVSDQQVQSTLVQEDGVEMVVSEEDSQLVGAQALLQGAQAMLCKLARSAIQEVLYVIMLCRLTGTAIQEMLCMQQNSTRSVS